MTLLKYPLYAGSHSLYVGRRGSTAFSLPCITRLETIARADDGRWLHKVWRVDSDGAEIVRHTYFDGALSHEEVNKLVFPMQVD